MKFPGVKLEARRLLDRPVVDEHPLGRLRPQVDGVPPVLHRTHVRLEHQVEPPCRGEPGPPAVRTRGRARLVLDELVLAVAVMAGKTFDQRIGERGHVAARLPHPGRHDDRRLHTDDVVARLDHGTPPGPLDVVADLHAERAVVPGRTQPAVDLAGGEGDPPALCQGGDGVHQVGHAAPSDPGRWLRPLACGP